MRPGRILTQPYQNIGVYGYQWCHIDLYIGCGRAWGWWRACEQEEHGSPGGGGGGGGGFPDMLEVRGKPVFPVGPPPLLFFVPRCQTGLRVLLTRSNLSYRKLLLLTHLVPDEFDEESSSLIRTGRTVNCCCRSHECSDARRGRESLVLNCRTVL